MAKTWVTKTDITRYLRCPYAFWLVDSGQLKAEALLSPLANQLVANGVAFQALVETPLPKVEVPAGGLRELFARADLRLYGIPMVRNGGLRVMGTPDGVETASGALYPIEVKSHRKPTALDRIELAFYWVLLAPYRSAWPDPEGVLVLPGDDGGTTTVRVALSVEDFDEVHRLVAAVRRARTDGVEPRVCRCNVCSGRPEVIAAAGTRRDLTMVYGINSKYATALEDLGCRRYVDLAGLDPVATVAAFRARKLFISAGVLERWQLHARAYAEGRPVLRAGREHLPKLGRYIALDLEWDLEQKIWLVGAGYVKGNEVLNVFQWWADDEDEEWTALARLAENLNANPRWPIVTWNGKGADLPRLRERCAAVGVDDFVPAIDARHLDLYLWAQDCLRLPAPSLGLKELAGAFGFAKASSVRSGMEAMALYFDYLEATDPKARAKLQRQLKAYNRDDVASLAHVAMHLVALDTGPAPLPLGS